MRLAIVVPSHELRDQIGIGRVGAPRPAGAGAVGPVGVSERSRDARRTWRQRSMSRVSVSARGEPKSRAHEVVRRWQLSNEAVDAELISTPLSITRRTSEVPGSQ